MAFGFGATLSNLYKAASDASKAAFNKAAKTTKEAANALEHGYEYSKEKAVQAYGYSKEKVSQAYDYGKGKANQAYVHGKEKASQAYDYGKEKTKKAKDYAVKKYDGTKKSVKKKITDAKKAAQKAAIKPQPAGSATASCPLKEQEKYKLKLDELFSTADKEDYTDIKPQAKAEIAVKIEKKLQDESYMMFGDKDNNVKIGHTEGKVAHGYSFNPLENEHELSLFKTEKKYTALEANLASQEDNLLEAKAHGEVLSAQYNVDPLSATYSKGNVAVKSEAGAEANLIKGSAEGKLNITPKTFYDNTVGLAVGIFSSKYSKAPDWTDHGFVFGAGGEAGIGAAAKASAKGQIGKAGANLELEAKVGLGPMAGLKLFLGVK
ncbi:MAG: hypothetical protein NTV43_18380 [Methylococcales bacterium]|nr:hypothetical protein [Methylococcales bacterium]